MMGVEDAGFGLVDDLPSRVENAFRNANVFENAQVFGELRRLPNATPNGGIHVGKVIETVAQAVAMSGVFNDPVFAVDGVEDVMALKRSIVPGKLSAIDSAYHGIVEVRRNRFEPVVRCRNGILREKDHNLAVRHARGDVSGSGMVKGL